MRAIRAIARRLRTLGDPLFWWVYGVTLVALFVLYEIDRLLR